MSGGFSQSSAGGGNVVSGSLSTQVTNQVIMTVTSSLPVTITSGTLQLSGSVDTSNGALESTQLLGIPKAATLAKIWRFNVTGSQSTQLSFLTLPCASLVSAISGSKVFSLKGDPYTPIYYAFSTGSTGESVDSTDVTGAKQCDTLFPGERFDMQIPIGISSLIVSASVTSSLSLAITS
jgi:hypothetical protein